MLLTMVGSVLGGWWLVSQQRARASRSMAARPDRGTVIFDNTPRAADSEAMS